MELTKRVKVNTGYRCNANCRFCYYRDSIKSKNPPTEEIEAKLVYARKRGILDIDFSGGEPTIRPDFLDLVGHARELGFRQICVITNGIRLANEAYFSKLVQNGLNEVLFSIEGHEAAVHDDLTKTPGSFEKLNRAMQYAKKSGVKTRTNTTVTRVNYKHLRSLASYLLDIQPAAANFILFNDWNDARKSIRDMACKYSTASPYLKDAIDVLAGQIRKVTVRYIPYCFMVGYEKHVCNLLQKRCDPDEWDDAIKKRLLNAVDTKTGGPKLWTAWLREALLDLAGIVGVYPRLREVLHDIEVRHMRKCYEKRPACRTCKYYFLCDGLEDTYAAVIGLDELEPVVDQRIRDPFFFLRNSAVS